MPFIELPYVTIYYEEPVVIFIYKRKTLLGVPELKQVVAIAEKLSEGRPYVTYSDVRQAIDITDQAKKFHIPKIPHSAFDNNSTVFYEKFYYVYPVLPLCDRGGCPSQKRIAGGGTEQV